MSMQKVIERKVRDSLNPQFLQIENESHNHGGPATESHFKLTVVADEFEGLTPVKRHQKLYGILADEMSASVHALALHLYTPEQWRVRKADSPESPNCRGGSQ